MTTPTLATRRTDATASDRPRLEPPKDARRRPLRALVMVMVAALCAAGFAALLAAAGDRQAVLAMARTVPAGRVITADDLRVVEVSADKALRTLPAGQRDEVVGRSAISTLVAGTLLTNAQLAERVGPAVGESVVGLRLKGTRVPPASMGPGDRVQIIQTASPTEADVSVTEEGQLLLGSVLTEGRVLSVERTREASDTVELSVAMQAVDAPAVAGAAAADRVTVVLIGVAG